MKQLRWFLLSLFVGNIAFSAELQLPVLLYQPAAVYPPESLAAGEGAEVLLEIDISREGLVLDARVVEGADPAFDAAALQVARSFRFTPALDESGEATTARFRYRYRFSASTAEARSIEGTVANPSTNLPLEGVGIQLTGPSGESQAALTDSKGQFTFSGLANGEWSLAADFNGVVTGQTTVTVQDSKVTTVAIYPDSAEIREFDGGLEVIVEARRPTVEVTERVLTTEEIQYLPGTGGDIVRVIQNFPGVTRPPLGVGQLIIRGVAPEDSSYFFGGGRIPLVFHFSGLTTVLPSDVIEEVAYLPGSYSVRYGRVLGGLVDLRPSIELPEEQHRTYASVDVYQSTVFSEHKVGDKMAMAVAGRRSYIDAVLNPILNNGASQVQAPRYYDFSMRLWATPKDGELWDAFFVTSDDRFRVVGPENEGGDVQIGLVTSFQKLRLQNRTTLKNGLDVETTIIGGPETQTFQFDGDGEAYEKPFMIGFRREYKQYNEDEDDWKLRMGIDSEVGRYRYLYDVPFFGEPEGGDTYMINPGFYGEFVINQGPIRLTPGVRTDALFFEDGIVGPVADPRLALRWKLNDFTTLKGGVGKHSQFPLIRELLSEGSGVPSLEAEWSIQSSLGIERLVTDALTMEIGGFWHQLGNLVSGREDAFRFFTGPPPIGPFDTGEYANDGVGKVYGLEGLIRLKADRTVGLIAFTWSRSYRTDRPDEEEELFAYDSPITLNALISRELPKNWRLGARVRTSSGYAYTPVVNRWLDLDGRSFFPIYGERDSARLPQFFALDLRIDKEWNYRNWDLTFYLDLQNATSTTNPEWMSWTYDYREEDPVDSIPALPAFGLKGEW